MYNSCFKFFLKIYSYSVCNKMYIYVFGVQFFILLQTILAKDCIKRSYGEGSFVCVCNATYCDTYEPATHIDEGNYMIYTTTKDGLRLKKSFGKFQQDKSTDSKSLITINAIYQYQEIYGWGTAFTDSAGYNLDKLNKNAQDNLLRSYFSKDGLEYSLCRVTIASSDFSIREYSYDETPLDKNLTKFNLTIEDYNYKIPFILKAIALSDNNLQLFATAWNPPLWMKTNNKSTGIGYLKKEYYQAYADYHLKFLDAYDKNGIQFWGLTTGNEPMLGLTPFFNIPGLGWWPWDQGQWIGGNLGPTIRKSKYSKIKIIALDDERLQLPIWIILQNIFSNANDYMDGIAVHWYTDDFFPWLLSLTHFIFPNKFIINTEACAGDKRFKRKVVLGAWKRAELYVEDILEDLENWVTGWVDWNFALNLKGGPTYLDNPVDSSIIINVTAQEFYKQTTYFAMGHFSKFIPPKSVKILTEVKGPLKAVAFTRPDKSTALVIYNHHNNNITVSIYDKRRGYINIKILQKSINTIVYW